MRNFTLENAHLAERARTAAELRRSLAANPSDRVSWHNLAAAEGDLGHAAESESAARRAIALGINAPETRLVLARALQSQRRLDEAEAAFAEALQLRPTYVDAHRDLAQLVWMRSGDVGAALRRVDAAIAMAPRDGGLHHVKSVVLEYAGERPRALSAAETGLVWAPGDVRLLSQAAHLAVELGQAARGLELAHRAVRCAPPGSGHEVLVCEALVALGRLAEAEPLAAALRSAHPHNQYLIALHGVIWRLTGDARYRELFDYERLVQPRELEVPEGWSDLDAFLRDAAAELESMHAFHTHPLQQSVRGGSQVALQPPELARPVIKALFASIVAAVGRYVEGIGHGADPLGARNTGRFALSPWSVRLRSGGYHSDHVHPEGWISSACYIALPPTIGKGDDRAGWLRLGKPSIPTPTPLAAERYVEPRPGRLVLFPAYMLHGVEPFESDQPRLSVAFDVIPI